VPGSGNAYWREIAAVGRFYFSYLVVYVDPGLQKPRWSATRGMNMPG